ncbi:MAG: hypothetical protein ABIH42_09245 [Planctomycetota bacterium]
MSAVNEELTEMEEMCITKTLSKPYFYGADDPMDSSMWSLNCVKYWGGPYMKYLMDYLVYLKEKTVIPELINIESRTGNLLAIIKQMINESESQIDGVPLKNYKKRLKSLKESVSNAIIKLEKQELDD